MEKVLVTGASGFIGSFIVEEGLKRGYEVWAAVRRSSSKQFLQDDRIQFIELDLDSKERLVEQLRGHEFTYVVHAAGVTKCKDKQDFFRVNTEGTRHLVEALLEVNMPLKRLVYLSSLSIFGPIREQQPYEEIRDTDTPQPNTAYGESKLAAEAFLSMCAAMSEDGLGIVPISGYVSFDEQRALLDSTADRLVAEGVSTEEARQRASQEVSAPGQDEAQLGTSIDVSTDISSPSGFSLTEQYQWICRNAHKYGFIIRYTASKRKVTGVAEKPWRLRYVGVQAAECMVSSNMCLEEYAGAVRSDNPDATEEF